MECFDKSWHPCDDARKWLEEQLREIFKPPTDNWDRLRAWVLRFGDIWDEFLIELTIPEF